MPRNSKQQKNVVEQQPKIKVSKKETEEVERDENLNTVIELKPANDVQALINTQLKETGKIYTDDEGKQYKYILTTGVRKSKTGASIPYTYKKIYYLKQNGLKRGPAEAPNKKLLRKFLTKLKDADCAKILNYISNNIKKVNNGCEDNKSNNTEQDAL